MSEEQEKKIFIKNTSNPNPIKIKLKQKSDSPNPSENASTGNQNKQFKVSFKKDETKPYQDRPYNRDSGTGGGYNNNRPAGTGTGGGYNNNRPAGTGTGGGYNNNRPAGTGTGGGYNNNRPGGTGTGGGYNNNRPAGTGTGGGYNNNRPAGTGTGGGYNNNRPAGTGTGGGYNNNRPAGTGTGGGYNNNRPGGTGTGGGYNNNRPAGTGTGGGYNNNRPGGTGTGGGYNNNRPGGTGTGGGYNNNRPAGTGGYRPPGQGPGGYRPFNKDQDKDKAGTTGEPQTKKDFFSNTHKRVGKTDFKKHKDFQNLKENREVDFQLKYKKKTGVAVIPEKIEINDTILVNDLAVKMNLKVTDLISKLLSLGYIATLTDALDAETAEIVASEFGCHVVVKSHQDDLTSLINELGDKEAALEERPPVVTIMGHVDHGKTTLLDYIRKTRVAQGESGGITQHVGAYQIEHNHKKITFIDTPGHEAFTQMRERGASITDIVILVVAADDGIMPQTLEALSHAQVAHVPIIVAINKIDKEGSNPESIKNQLSEKGLLPEDWGGDTMYIPVSALKGTGVDNLLEGILLVADMKEFKAAPTRLGRGVILESKMDKSRGSTATVIVQDGTLRKGDIFVSGTSINRIRAMYNHLGEEVPEAIPSTPVELLGFEEVPMAGDVVNVTRSEKEAREIVEKKKTIHQIEHAKKIHKVGTSLDDLYNRIQEQGKVDFNIIVKADVQGTAEAIKSMIEKLALQIDDVNLKVIQNTVGAITENDILLASTSKALIVGFNVRINNEKTSRLAKEKAVEVRRYSIIYEITNDIKDAIEGMLEPERTEKIMGEAVVKQVFKIPKVGLIAGSTVTDGVIKNNSAVRVIRDGVVLFTGKIITLKRFKEDVKEATKGYECGIEIANFKDIKENDVFETFEIEKTSKKLVLKDPTRKKESDDIQLV